MSRGAPLRLSQLGEDRTVGVERGPCAGGSKEYEPKETSHTKKFPSRTKFICGIVIDGSSFDCIDGCQVCFGAPSEMSHRKVVMFKPKGAKTAFALRNGHDVGDMAKQLGLNASRVEATTRRHRSSACRERHLGGRTIPMIGIATLSNDVLLDRLLTALDVPINDLAIVQNGYNEAVAWVLRRFARCQLSRVRFESPAGSEPWQPDYLTADAQACDPAASCVRSLTVFQNGENRGCAQAWNLILRLAWRRNAAYAIIMNDDITFVPGELAKVHAHIASRLGEADVLARGAFFTLPSQSGGHPALPAPLA